MERGPREMYQCNLIYISIVDLHNKMICTHLNVRTAYVAFHFKSLKRLAREHEKLRRTANDYYHLDASISLLLQLTLGSLQLHSAPTRSSQSAGFVLGHVKPRSAVSVLHLLNKIQRVQILRNTAR